MTTAARGRQPWSRPRRELRRLAERLTTALEEATVRLLARALEALAVRTESWRAAGAPGARGRVVVSFAGADRREGAPAGHQVAPRAPAAEELAALAEIAAAARTLADARVPAASLVSVVVVTADWPESLAAAIASVRRQSYPAWELVVVDAGDGPPPALGDHDGKIRVVAGGVGLAAAHNRGLEAATGQLVTHLGDRSEMARHWLRAVVSTLIDSPGAEVVIGHRVTFAGEGDPGADLVAACCAGCLAFGADGTPLDGMAYRRDLAAARMVDGPAPDPVAHLAGLVALPARRRVPHLSTIARATLPAAREAAGVLAGGEAATAATFPEIRSGARRRLDG